jgi:hypothetical protein
LDVLGGARDDAGNEESESGFRRCDWESGEGWEMASEFVVVVPLACFEDGRERENFMHRLGYHRGCSILVLFLQTSIAEKWTSESFGVVAVFAVFGLVPARRGERVGVGLREHRAVGEIEEVGRVANAERDECQFARTDVDEGVYELLHAGVAVVVFVHVEAKREGVRRRCFSEEEKDALKCFYKEYYTHYYTTIIITATTTTYYLHEQRRSLVEIIEQDFGEESFRLSQRPH